MDEQDVFPVMKMLVSGEVDDDFVLQEVYEIGDALLALQHMEEQVDYYKNLKKRQTAAIDKQVKKFESRSQKIRTVVENTMKSTCSDRDTADFPGIGKVTMRKSPDKWEIDDEGALIGWLEENEKDDAVVVKSVKKSEFNKLVRKDPDVREADGIAEKKGEKKVSISFATKLVQEVNSQIEEKLPEDFTLDQLDELEV